ncbi:hypothetical protein [Streptomyces sp. CC219B]|uniref:hypothetical protein n=1 Tax=Streptomyces sp. CC219B TaxID=3044574 RepID=UPI0024A7CE85|nr:hypothetical protein [Streptomyces sp. CC219B]
MPKTVIHIFQAGPDSRATRAHVAEPVRRVAADRPAQRGIQLWFARDAFARYGQESAAVISF